MLPIITPLLALLLPVYALRRAEKKPLRRPYLISLGSFACAFAATLAELYVIKKRVLSEDMAGIMDTIDAVLLICGAIAVITLLVNLLALRAFFEKKDEEESQS